MLCRHEKFIEAVHVEDQGCPATITPEALSKCLNVAKGATDLWLYGVIWGYIGIMEKKMETTGIIGVCSSSKS